MQQDDEVKLDEEYLLRPGLIKQHPLEKLHMDEKSVLRECVPESWSNGDGSTFNVRRGPNYKENGIKAPSAGSLYEIFAYDGWSTKERKINNISRFYKMPTRPPVPEKYDIPPVLLINVLIPDYSPPLWGKPKTDGKGYSMVFFGELSAKSREFLNSDKLTPALRLFQEFIRGGKSSKYGDRLKCIARILNCDEAAKSYGRVASLLVTKYNGTPFLARDSPTFKYVRGKYFSIDLDAHLFGKMAKSGLNSIKDYMNKVVFDFGFVIEGRGDDENPEQILACIRVSKTGGSKAKQFPYENLI